MLRKNAEKYREEDEKLQENIAVRNQLEGYAFSVKSPCPNTEIAMTPEDKSAAQSACEETLKWIDANSLADKEELEHKCKELQDICSKVMSKIHQTGGSQQTDPHSFQAGDRGSHNGPTVEEVD